ncbi:MAG: hypothetical protein ACT4QA_23975 [Panacagrimonas sp.]
MHALGYLYPDFGTGSHAHFNLVHQLRTPTKFRPGHETWEQVVQLAAENPDKCILLSAESFQDFGLGHIAAVRRYLPDADLRMVVYLREQAAFLESWRSQMIKTGSPPVEVEVLGESLVETLTFTRLLKPWRDILGREKMAVRVFDRSRFVNGDLIDDFLHVVGLPTQAMHMDYARFSARNVGPGPKALGLLDVVNRELSVHAARMGFGSDHLRKALTSVLYSSVRQWPREERARMLTPEQRAAFQQRFAADNARVLSEYLNDECPSLFPAARDGNAPANLRDSAAVVASLPPLDLVRTLAYALASSLQREVEALRGNGSSVSEMPAAGLDAPAPSQADRSPVEGAEARRRAAQARRRDQRRAARRRGSD